MALVETITSLSEKKKLFVLLIIALAIRLFLLFHTYVIVKDGITIIALARDFASGNFARVALSFFPPLYPLLIALAAALAYLTRIEGIGILIVVGLGVLLQNYSQFRQTYKKTNSSLSSIPYPSCLSLALSTSP